MKLLLRPHHLLCLQKYTGHGYDETFTIHADNVTQALSANPEMETEIVKGCDIMCGKCPFNNGGTCKTEEKVNTLDAEVLKTCAVQYGDIGCWKDFSQKAKELILDTEEFDRICSCCSWYELCRNTEIE